MEQKPAKSAMHSPDAPPKAPEFYYFFCQRVLTHKARGVCHGPRVMSVCQPKQAGPIRDEPQSNPTYSLRDNISHQQVGSGQTRSIRIGQT